MATENFINIISFLPPNSYRTLSSSEQKSYQWDSKFLHGIVGNGRIFLLLSGTNHRQRYSISISGVLRQEQKENKYSHGTTSEKRNQFGEVVLFKY